MSLNGFKRRVSDDKGKASDLRIFNMEIRRNPKSPPLDQSKFSPLELDCSLELLADLFALRKSIPIMMTQTLHLDNYIRYRGTLSSNPDAWNGLDLETLLCGEWNFDRTVAQCSRMIVEDCARWRHHDHKEFEQWKACNGYAST